MGLNDYSDIKGSLDGIYEKGSVFVLEMHSCLHKRQTLQLLSNLVHCMKAKNSSVYLMKLGDFEEGYLNSTIKHENGTWIIG